jgi:nitroimidazol reductase NimA-like FMN-containing flavoprotein (pyridoxamine 5'-phosphate oxidase superfamily)
MTRADLLAFLRSHRYAVQSSVSSRQLPQSAVVGVAVSDTLEVVFDTLRTSRKAQNLALNPAIALTFGSLEPEASRTVQLEGRAEILEDPEREPLVALYLAVFPDGRERQQWPGLIYVRVQLLWMRDSDYSVTPPRIDEWDHEALAMLA